MYNDFMDEMEFAADAVSTRCAATNITPTAMD